LLELKGFIAFAAEAALVLNLDFPNRISFASWMPILKGQNHLLRPAWSVPKPWSECRGVRKRPAGFRKNAAAT
jgi:hypothetical protein